MSRFCYILAAIDDHIIMSISTQLFVNIIYPNNYMNIPCELYYTGAWDLRNCPSYVSHERMQIYLVFVLNIILYRTYQIETSDWKKFNIWKGNKLSSEFRGSANAIPPPTLNFIKKDGAKYFKGVEGWRPWSTLTLRGRFLLCDYFILFLISK